VPQNAAKCEGLPPMPLDDPATCEEYEPGPGSMNALSPIPTPASRRWREFRIRFLPGLIFACGLATTSQLWTHVVHDPSWPSQETAALTELGPPTHKQSSQLYGSHLQDGEHRSKHSIQRGLARGANRAAPALTYGNDAPQSTLLFSFPLPGNANPLSNGTGTPNKAGASRN
jgi:hypothetical protein